MGTRAVAGPRFRPEDTPTGQRTAIINRTFATNTSRAATPSACSSPAGYPTPNPANEVTVVGVIEDVGRNRSARWPSRRSISLMRKRRCGG